MKTIIANALDKILSKSDWVVFALGLAVIGGIVWLTPFWWMSEAISGGFEIQHKDNMILLDAVRRNGGSRFVDRETRHYRNVD